MKKGIDESVLRRSGRVRTPQSLESGGANLWSHEPQAPKSRRRNRGGISIFGFRCSVVGFSLMIVAVFILGLLILDHGNSIKWRVFDGGDSEMVATRAKEMGQTHTDAGGEAEATILELQELQKNTKEESQAHAINETADLRDSNQNSTETKLHSPKANLATDKEKGSINISSRGNEKRLQHQLNSEKDLIARRVAAIAKERDERNQAAKKTTEGATEKHVAEAFMRKAGLQRAAHIQEERGEGMLKHGLFLEAESPPPLRSPFPPTKPPPQKSVEPQPPKDQHSAPRANPKSLAGSHAGEHASPKRDRADPKIAEHAGPKSLTDPNKAHAGPKHADPKMAHASPNKGHADPKNHVGPKSVTRPHTGPKHKTPKKVAPVDRDSVRRALDESSAKSVRAEVSTRKEKERAEALEAANTHRRELEAAAKKAAREAQIKRVERETAAKLAEEAIRAKELSVHLEMEEEKKKREEMLAKKMASDAAAKIREEKETEMKLAAERERQKGLKEQKKRKREEAEKWEMEKKKRDDEAERERELKAKEKAEILKKKTASNKEENQRIKDRDTASKIHDEKIAAAKQAAKLDADKRESKFS